MPVLISATESKIGQHSRGLIEHTGLMEKELITLGFWQCYSEEICGVYKHEFFGILAKGKGL